MEVLLVLVALCLIVHLISKINVGEESTPKPKNCNMHSEYVGGLPWVGNNRERRRRREQDDDFNDDFDNDYDEDFDDDSDDDSDEDFDDDFDDDIDNDYDDDYDDDSYDDFDDDLDDDLDDDSSYVDGPFWIHNNKKRKKRNHRPPKGDWLDTYDGPRPFYMPQKDDEDDY